MSPASISVVIPAYNSAATIGAALESVLAQVVAPLEVVVADDGSTDTTGEVVAQWFERFGGRLRLQRAANGGPAFARNRGILATSGALIAFLDADDAWDPNHLETLRPAFEGSAPAVLAFADVRRMQAGRSLGCVLDGPRAALLADSTKEASGLYLAGPRFREITLPKFTVLPSAMMVTRDAIAAAGLFDPRARHGEDLDFVMRVAPTGPVRWFDGATSQREERPNSHGKVKAGASQELSLTWVLARLREFGPPATASDLAGFREAIDVAAYEAGYEASDAGMNHYLSVAGQVRRWTGKHPPQHWRLLLRSLLQR